MEERTQEYYMCGGNLHTLPPLWVQRAFLQPEQAQPEIDVAPFPGFDTYQEVQRENELLRAKVVQQSTETEKWRQLYSVSRHQAGRSLDMLNAAKVQIEVLENKLNGRQ